MQVDIATVRDLQSAEYLKSLALTETDLAVALPLWHSARELDPSSTTLACHEALALFQLGELDAVIALAMEVFPAHPRLVHMVNLFAASLAKKGHLDPSSRLLKFLLTMDPDYPNARTSLNDMIARRSPGVPASPEVLRAVGQGIERGRRIPRPTLAVCMIVKDEEEFIGDAIRSVRGVADEIIIVDTGSQDATVKISKAEGAQVGFFQWTGDFSEARNVSLDMATSDWVLVLDADERLTEGSKNALRAVLEEYQQDDLLRVICVRIKNYTRAGDFMSDGFSGRVFRNRPDMRFEGRVHEEVAKNRTDVATDYRLDIEFDHFGADPEVMEEKGKDQRNIELLEARLVQVPDDLMTWFYLASQHWVASRVDEAIEAFERVVDYYNRDPSRYGVAVRSVTVAYSYVGLIRGLLQRRRPSEAETVAFRALGLFPDNPDIRFQTGLVQMELGDLPAARDEFERAATTKLSGYGLIGMSDRSIQEWRACKLMADIDFHTDDRSSAYEGYLRVLDAIPDDFDEWHVVYARLVEMASSLKRFDDLPRWTLKYLEYRPSELHVGIQVGQQLAGLQMYDVAAALLGRLVSDVPNAASDLHLNAALGQLAELTGDDKTALDWYKIAAQLGHPDPSFWLNLANLFVRNENHAAAQQALQVAQRLSAS